MKFTLFISHEYTDYRRVKQFYDRGNEIAVHSVTHSAIDNDKILRKEAKQQRENLINKAGVPSEEILGWRSPFLKTAGNNQPKILHELGYQYDISLTYVKSSLSAQKPWPFTIENGWPYSCGVRPCPHRAREKGFWEVPVVSMMDHKKKYPCSFVDGCAVRANNEHEAFKYLYDNFMSYYNTTRTPFGLNMHAAWFYTPHNLKGMMRFLDELQKFDDVYVITVKQVLDWMKQPTPLSEIHRMTSWGCPEARWPQTAVVKRRTTTTSTTTSTTTTRRPTTTTTKNPTTTTTTTTTTTPRSTTTTTTTRKPTTTTTTTGKTTTTTTTRKPTTTSTTTTRKPTTTTTTTTKRPTTTTTKRPTTRKPIKRQTRPTRRTTPKPTTTTMTTSLFRAQTTKERAKAFIDSVSNSVHSGAPTIAPWFKAWFNAPTTLTPPFIRTDWWKLWGMPIEKGTIITSCVQGTNCKLPDCFCQGEAIPNNLPLDETPQMIFITIDGSVNPSVYRRYRDIFRTRRNPNRCDAKGTVFATASGSYRYFIQRIRSLGAEIAMRGLHEHHFDTAEHLEKEIIAQKKSLKRSGIPDVNGWKTPESKSLGDDQFKVLSKHGFLYDSTLATNLPDGGSMNPWPFTLDYGFNGECVIPICPRGKFPGLWEIPNNPVRDYRGMFECSYVDGCMFNPPTVNDTTEFLMKNFLFNYKTNKAPFGIHLRQVWFSHPAYANNIKGLKNFLDAVQKLHDVYLVSASGIIEWMKNPTPISEITQTVPWNCGRKK